MIRSVMPLLAICLLATPVEATETVDSGDFPLSGSVLGEISLGMGTFTPGPASRPYLNLLTEFALDYSFEQLGLVLGLNFSLNVNAVENADSGNTVPHQLKPGDLELTGDWKGLIPSTAIGLEVVPKAAIILPTSLESQHVGKIMGLRLGVTTSIEPEPWVAADLRLSVTKNLNTYTTGVLDADDFDRAPLSRAGGAEAVANGRIATGSAATSWHVVWGTGVSFSPLKDLSVLIDFEMLHLFSYDIPIDQFSSPHAQAGQTDLMYGTLEVSWDVIDHLSLALGSYVEQTPLTDDNQSLRFPFWDTTNGAMNRQVIYLDVIGSF